MPALEPQNIAPDDFNTQLIFKALTLAFRSNTGLAKVAVQCSADTFVVNQSLILRINICGENRHLRQARTRYLPFQRKTV
jgi:hypothetical protein